VATRDTLFIIFAESAPSAAVGFFYFAISLSFRWTDPTADTRSRTPSRVALCQFGGIIGSRRSGKRRTISDAIVTTINTGTVARGGPLISALRKFPPKRKPEAYRSGFPRNDSRETVREDRQDYLDLGIDSKEGSKMRMSSALSAITSRIRGKERERKKKRRNGKKKEGEIASIAPSNF